MTARLPGFLRVEAGEGVKVLHFAGVGLLLQAGLAVGINAADSIFLARVGAGKLAHIYMLTPAMMLLYVPVYTTLLRRHGLDRVFDGIIGLLFLGGLAFWAAFTLQGAAPDIWLCYAVKLYTALWYIGLYTLYWSFIDGYFDLPEAKRLFALFAAGSAVGGMLGGTLVSSLAGTVGIAGLFLGWALLAAGSWPLLQRTRSRWRRIEADNIVVPETAAPSGGGSVALAGVRSLLRSRYATVLALAIFLRLVAATLCDYQYLGIFSSGRDAVQLAALFGGLTAAVNVLNLFLTLFCFNHLVARFGVRNVALLQPVVFGAVFAWLFLQHGFPAAVAGFFAYHGLMTAIEFNNVNLLFSGLPAASRKEIRTFIEGLCEPSAAAAAGLFLLLAAAGLTATQLSLAGLAVVCAGLGFTLAMRRNYAAAIAENLRRDWLDLSRWPGWLPRPARTHTESPEPAAVLASGLLTVRGADRARLLARLEERASIDALPGLLQAAGDFTPRERHEAERLLVACGPAAVPALIDAARSPRSSVRARSITLRALGKLDFASLQAVVPPLVEATARKAYYYLGAHATLAAGGAREPGRAVLADIYRHYPNLTLEIVLEALTIAGRLPPYEALVVALQSGRSKERGFAVETVAQAAGRRLFLLLAPWLDGRGVAAQLAHGRRHGWMPQLSERAVLQHALQSAFPLESTAAWQALSADRDPALQPMLDAKLADAPSTWLTATAATWRARAPRGPAAPLTPVERVAALMRTPEFDGFDFTQHEFLGLHTTELAPAPGEPLTGPDGRTDAMWLVLDGGLIDTASPAAHVLPPGTLVGADDLLGGSAAGRGLQAGPDTRLITIPKAAVLDCAEIFPALGLNLLRRRFAP